MRKNFINFFAQVLSLSITVYKKYKEAIFVTKHQYKLRLINFYQCPKNGHLIAILQVIIKRVNAKFALQYVASNKYILSDIHPVDACRIAFAANYESNGKHISDLPDLVFKTNLHCPTVKQSPILKIKYQTFNERNNKTFFYLSYLGSEDEIEISAEELMAKQELLYGLGSINAASVGYCASEDRLRSHSEETRKNTIITDINVGEKSTRQIVSTPNNMQFYHILCVAYVGILISGISVVSRLFPFHVPETNRIIPLCAGMIFYPLTFFIQDVTTEVYGYSRSRQMVWLAIGVILFYVLYTQIAIHLPSSPGVTYANNPSFNVVFGAMPRQLISLIVSLLIGSLINDYFLSKSKIIFAGQYLWARVIGSTMVGEAVLQIVGNIIGFSHIMDFYTQLLPNTVVAYSYKLLWNLALIPVIYMVTHYLKKKEGINVFDYDVNYNPFIFRL